MHAEAGDTVQIWLQNLLTVPVNIEPMSNAWDIETVLKPVGAGMTASFVMKVREEAPRAL